MSSEYLVKQTLIKIIENAKFDCERENYKWFKLNFLNDDRKSFAGDYDMRTHIIRVFVPKTSAKTNANLICTTLHEVSHHIDWCNRHTSDHSDAFYEIFQKLLYSALDLNVVSVSDIKNMPRLTTDHNKILKFIKIYSPNPNKDINENYLIVNVYNCYSEKEKLKENGYFWNGTLKAWYKKIKKEDQIKEQNLERGIKGIEDFCKSRNYKLEKVFVDKMSGRTVDRPRYTVLKEDVLREGDTLIIYELDRLARDKKAISNELRYYDEHNIRVMILDIPTTTTDLPDADAMNKLIVETINKVIIDVYAMLAETELQRKTKRQQEGLIAMKERGEWDNYGRHRVMSLPDFEKEYQNVKDGKIKSLELMRKLNMKKSTYFKYVREIKLMDGNCTD